MKNTFLLVLFLITNFGISQNSITGTKENPLIGKWVGMDNNGISNGLILDNDNFIIFISANETFGGKEFESDGENHSYKYEVDTSVNPIRLDYVLYKKTDQKSIEEKRFKSIVRFIDSSTIEIRTSFNSEYPIEFSSKKEDTIILKRV